MDNNQDTKKKWYGFLFDNLSEKNSDDSKNIIKMWVVMVILSFFWVSSGLTLYFMFPEWDGRGTFGDMFGTTNSLFSGLAFAGIIYTIFLQRVELRLQREELKLQREAVENSTNELAGQKNLMDLQSFENTFFQMISLHNEIVRSFINETGTLKGREFLRHINISCQFTYENELATITRKKHFHNQSVVSSIEIQNKYDNDTRYTAFIETYTKFYKDYENQLGQYFRNLYHIIRRVHRSKCLPSFEAKMEYIRIIRAQLSTPELHLIYFNCMYSYGYKLKVFADQYKLFDNMIFDKLNDPGIQDVYINLQEFDPCYSDIQQQMHDINTSV